MYPSNQNAFVIRGQALSAFVRHATRALDARVGTRTGFRVHARVDVRHGACSTRARDSSARARARRIATRAIPPNNTSNTSQPHCKPLTCAFTRAHRIRPSIARARRSVHDSTLAGDRVAARDASRNRLARARCTRARKRDARRRASRSTRDARAKDFLAKCAETRGWSVHDAPTRVRRRARRVHTRARQRANPARSPARRARETRRAHHATSGEDLTLRESPGGTRALRCGSPERIRTAASALRGRRPGPLDDGAGTEPDPADPAARGGGLEPPTTGPEPAVLPITPPPNGMLPRAADRLREPDQHTRARAKRTRAPPTRTPTNRFAASGARAARRRRRREREARSDEPSAGEPGPGGAQARQCRFAAEQQDRVVDR